MKKTIPPSSRHISSDRVPTITDHITSTDLKHFNATDTSTGYDTDKTVGQTRLAGTDKTANRPPVHAIPPIPEAKTNRRSDKTAALNASTTADTPTHYDTINKRIDSAEMTLPRHNLPDNKEMDSISEIWCDLLRDEIVPGKREVLQRFFKTGPGEYGEGDVFLGVTVPAVRKVSRLMADVHFGDIATMLASPVHEHRLSALLVLVERYRRARRDATMRRFIVDFYLTHTSAINNWDLVDLSAPKIIGEFVSETSDTDLLHRLSRSSDLWEQRIAIVATWTLLRDGQPRPTIEIAARYIPHRHDLIHKAAGWMLREMGKRIDQRLLTDFLDLHAPKMPRTMLRYAIEKLPAALRHHYLTLPRLPM